MDPRPTKLAFSKNKNRQLSRYGCRNCKLRKTKCDETKPCCKRCQKYGVSCNFGYDIPDLQPLHEATIRQILAKRTRNKLPSLQMQLNSPVWSGSGLSSLYLEERDRELLHRFRFQTVTTFGGSASVEQKILKDSFNFPVLMHGILAMAAGHGRYLHGMPASRHLKLEVYHSSQCMVLFNKLLCENVLEEEKDAIWAVAVILATLAFSSICVSSIEQAWPHSLSDTSYLQWLRLKISDKVMWHIADPSRPESAFRELVDTFRHDGPLPTSGVDGIPVELVEVCGLDNSSTSKSNPYFPFIHALVRIPKPRKGFVFVGQVFMALSVVSHELLVCLEKRDPVALLLLYIWYTKAREARWWIDQRAQYEIPAIRGYLQRHHKDNIKIQALLYAKFA